MKDESVLKAAGGLPPEQISSKYKASIEFTLPDSGMVVVMRKPMLRDTIMSVADTTVPEDNFVAQVTAMCSLISTFNGEAHNYHDLSNMLSLADYQEMATQYTGLINPK